MLEVGRLVIRRDRGQGAHPVEDAQVGLHARRLRQGGQGGAARGLGRAVLGVRLAPGRYHARPPASARREEHDAYGKALERLLRDLKVGTADQSPGYGKRG